MELVMDRWQRRMVFGIMPAVMVALVVLPAVLVRDDLPDPLATRFHPDGHATSWTPYATWVVVQLGISLACAIGLTAIGRRPKPDAPAMAALCAFVGFFTGVLFLGTALANRGVADWHDVTLGDGVLLGALGGALGWTLPVVLLAKRIAPPYPVYANQAVPLGPDDHAAWFGHARSAGFAVAGGVNVVLGLVVAVVEQLWVGALLVALGLVLASFATVLVTIDERGIGIRSGLIGWPRVRFPLSLIEEAELAEVRPIGLGGWGYRGSLRLFKRAAWVLRAGEGLRLQMRGGQHFVVSIDDAGEAAAVVNGLVARRSATPAG
jgi:hypothetical protein